MKVATEVCNKVENKENSMDVSTKCEFNLLYFFLGECVSVYRIYLQHINVYFSTVKHNYSKHAYIMNLHLQHIDFNSLRLYYML